METNTLPTNSIAFIGLCSEFCGSLENARSATRGEFVASMLRLLPRIYICATDLPDASDEFDEYYIDGVLDEEYYESVRRGVEALMGPDDMYLEVFEEDMKYSDTPIAASISEGLADLFQVFYNFLENIRQATDSHTAGMLRAVREDFASYWSRILCNLLRALNHVRYNGGGDGFEDGL
ncbi:MAG: DUF5063 domain-containing protein [Clostridium sp.]|nr:DUF5063 domain-containing protein [Clostridium sp.]